MKNFFSPTIDSGECVDKVERVGSGVDGSLFFFPSPCKGAEEKKIKTTPGAEKQIC